MYGPEAHLLRIADLRREAAAFRLAKEAGAAARRRRAEDEREGRVRKARTRFDRAA